MLRRRRFGPAAVLVAGWLVSSLAACAAAPAPETEPQAAPPSGEVETDGAPPASNTRISLERSECYGTCPVYRVTVRGDGSVVFEGMMWVETEGTARDTVPLARVAELVRAVEESGFFEVKVPVGPAECPRWATDHPSAVVEVRLGERKRRVDHDLGCHGFPGMEELVALELTIDRILGTERWIGHPVSG